MKKATHEGAMKKKAQTRRETKSAAEAITVAVVAKDILANYASRSSAYSITDEDILQCIRVADALVCALRKRGHL